MRSVELLSPNNVWECMKINFPKPLLRILEDNSYNTVDENSLQNCIRCKIPKALEGNS